MTSSMPSMMDGTGLMSRYSRQNRHNGRDLLPKCCQICNQRTTGLIVWDQPRFSFLKSSRIPDLSSEENYLRVASDLSKPIRKVDEIVEVYAIGRHCLSLGGFKKTFAVSRNLA